MDLYAALPPQLRARLVERLNHYVEFQRTKQYAKLYDLYSDDTIATVFNGQNKSEFVAAFNKGDEQSISVRLTEFDLVRVEKVVEGEVYRLYGDAKFYQQGEKTERHVVITATFRKGDWYFSTVDTVLQD